MDSSAKEQFAKYNKVKKAFFDLKKVAGNQSQVVTENDSKIATAQDEIARLTKDFEE